MNYAALIRTRRASILGVLALTTLNVSLVLVDATDPRWTIAQVVLTTTTLAAIWREARRTDTPT